MGIDSWSGSKAPALFVSLLQPIRLLRRSTPSSPWRIEYELPNRRTGAAPTCLSPWLGVSSCPRVTPTAP